jgi:hypothetical protein
VRYLHKAAVKILAGGLAFCFLAVPVKAEIKWTSEMTTELDILGLWTNRLVLASGASKLLLLDRRDVHGRLDDYSMAGFSSPALVLGPVDLHGLLREIGNPLGYGPRSGVFSETCGLSLKTGTDRSSRTGVWVSIPGDYAGVGAYRVDKETAHLAAAFNLGGPDTPEFSGLFLASHPDEGPPKDEWFPEKPSYPGGTLQHIAGRVRVPLHTLLGEETRLGLTWGLSRGERSPPSGFVHATALFRVWWLEMYLLSGSAGQGYLSPAGTHSSLGTRSAASAALFPKDLLSPRFSFSEDVYRRYALPVPSIPRRREISAGLGLKTRSFSGSLDRTWKYGWDESGSQTLNESFKAGVDFRTKTFSLGAEYSSDRENGAETRKTAAFEGEYRPKGWEFAMRCKGIWEPDPKVLGKISLAVSRPRMKAGVSAELVRPLPPSAEGILLFQENPLRFLCLSIYWKVRQGWN